MYLRALSHPVRCLTDPVTETQRHEMTWHFNSQVPWATLPYTQDASPIVPALCIHERNQSLKTKTHARVTEKLHSSLSVRTAHGKRKSAADPESQRVFPQYPPPRTPSGATQPHPSTHLEAQNRLRAMMEGVANLQAPLRPQTPFHRGNYAVSERAEVRALDLGRPS